MHSNHMGVTLVVKVGDPRGKDPPPPEATTFNVL